MFFMTKVIANQELKINETLEIPESLDWRDKGALNVARDQEFNKCGSCYAFSQVAALESHYFIKTGKLFKLSRQEVVDCSMNSGCSGGSALMTYNYIMENGISLDSDYPYKAEEGNCLADETPRSEVKMFGFVNFAGEENLQKALVQYGPVVVTINASPKTFNFYKDGIYDDLLCDNSKHNHAVLVVGYGTDEELGIDYWIVQNSFSSDWGVDGYIKMLRDNNVCGIGDSLQLPLLDQHAADENDSVYPLFMFISFLIAVLLCLCCICVCCCLLCKFCCRRKRSYDC